MECEDIKKHGCECDTTGPSREINVMRKGDKLDELNGGNLEMEQN
jgi:hypothetical protein